MLKHDLPENYIFFRQNNVFSHVLYSNSARGREFCVNLKTSFSTERVTFMKRTRTLSTGNLITYFFCFLLFFSTISILAKNPKKLKFSNFGLDFNQLASPRATRKMIAQIIFLPSFIITSFLICILAFGWLFNQNWLKIQPIGLIFNQSISTVKINKICSLIIATKKK